MMTYDDKGRHIKRRLPPIGQTPYGLPGSDYHFTNVQKSQANILQIYSAEHRLAGCEEKLYDLCRVAIGSLSYLFHDHTRVC